MITEQIDKLERKITRDEKMLTRFNTINEKNKYKNKVLTFGLFFSVIFFISYYIVTIFITDSQHLLAIFVSILSLWIVEILILKFLFRCF